MPGITDLKELLGSISPVLLRDEYVFCTVPGGNYGDFPELSPLSVFLEDEGLTLVIKKESAESSGFKFQGSFKCITLTVHSSLEAVGLTAVVSAKLSEHNISANIIAAYYHDHVFVPVGDADKAFGLLLEFDKKL